MTVTGPATDGLEVSHLPPLTAPAAIERHGGPGPAHRWHVRLLGRVEASDGVQTLQRFPSRAVAALLARLAVAPERAHAREELVELLWPGVDLPTGRNRLRQALSTLKGLLEAGAPAGGGGVLQADRLHVRVVPGALASDVQAFEQLARAGRLDEALALYRGEFMPGFYEDWIDERRLALTAEAERLAEKLDPGRPAVGGPTGRAGGRVSGGPTAAPATSTAPGTATASPTLSPPPPPPPPHATPPGAPAPASSTPARGAARLQLPHYLTRLVGAEAALAALVARVREHRLVTVVGPGGSGKTRLAVEAARQLADDEGRREGRDAREGPAARGPRFDLVAFVPMAACREREQALDALLGALRVAPAGGDAIDTLVDAMDGRRALLVLDNLEQGVEAAHEPLARLLALLPTLHVLATSRRLLALDGEQEFLAMPLALPSAAARLAEAAANPSVALFVERARAVRADFHLGERNAPVLAALVRALEGMPLAIELAASRVRTIAPAQMLERLRGPGAPRLELLARRGPRGAFDARHASMQRVIAWSWEQLAPAQAALVAALTVFPGGFTAEAAAFLAADDRPGATVLRLDELVAHSLLSARPGNDDRMRFSMYEPIREFATLTLSPPARHEARAGLRRWARAWAGSLPATVPLDDLRAEMPNLVAALAGAVDDGAPHEAIQLLLTLRRCLEDVELPAEALAQAQRAVAAAQDARLAAQGHSLLGPLLFTAGQREAALQHAEQGLAGAGPDAVQRARALHALARVCWRSRASLERVEPLLDEADHLLVAAAADGAPASAALDLHAGLTGLRAFVVNRQHRRQAEAERLHAQALTLWERSGNQHAIDSGRYNLAACAQDAQRHAEALERLAPVIASTRALGDWRRLSQALNVRGNALSGLRRWAEAVAQYRECIGIAWRVMSGYDLAYGLWNLPRALMHVRRPDEAVMLAAFADEHWRRHFGPLNAADRRYLLRIRRLARRQLPPARIEALWAQGAALAAADAVSLALA